MTVLNIVMAVFQSGCLLKSQLCVYDGRTKNGLKVSDPFNLLLKGTNYCEHFYFLPLTLLYQAMESFVAQMINYISDNELWAHQGGPIIMSQIENELGSGDDNNVLNEDNDDDGILYINSRGEFVNSLKENSITPIRKATLQDYANWCGEIAEKYAPHVTWTMCNGLSANNTIHTCNAINGGDGWLESYGGNGRIQVDQPPLCK